MLSVMNKTWLIGIAIVAVVFGMGTMQFLSSRGAPSATPPSVPAALESPPAGTSSAPPKEVPTVTEGSPARTVPELPSIATGDRISSWTFNGVYADNTDLKAKAETEIVRLKDLVGKGTYSDTALYVGIANQYELLGNGSLEYDYLGRAIEVASSTSGLPWHNLGVLMERLGALETARTAYEKATLIQPEMKVYHLAYLEFLTARMKNDTAGIEKAFAAALAIFNQDTELLRLRFEWQQS